MECFVILWLRGCRMLADSVIIERARELGNIDFDPCAHGGGLTQPWSGYVYLNPPYGRAIGRWIGKLVDEFENGGVTQALALVPSRPDTRWFRMLRDYPRCFVSGRIRFAGHHNAASSRRWSSTLAPMRLPSWMFSGELVTSTGEWELRHCSNRYAARFPRGLRLRKSRIYAGQRHETPSLPSW
jgi:hypothetical protein